MDTLPLTDTARFDSLLASAAQAVATVARDPRGGAALARATYARALHVNEPSVESVCTLALAQVENYLGNFHAAEDLAARVLQIEGEHGEPSRIWQAWRARAVACRELGEFGAATEAFNLLRDLNIPSDAASQASFDWLAGEMALTNTRYGEAQILLKKAERQYLALGQAAHAARCCLRYARATYFLDMPAMRPHLDRARATFEALALPLDVALCDWAGALYLRDRAERHAEALAVLQRAAGTFADLSAPTFAAGAQVDQAIVLLRIGQHAEAEAMLTKARKHFLAQNSMSEVVRCNINLAALYNEAYRPEDSIPLLVEASEFSLRSGRAGRAARCYGGLADSYRLQGQYDRALSSIQEAIALFEQQQMPSMVAECREVLAGIYDRLGLGAAAVKAYNQALAYYAEKGMALNLAAGRIRLAELLSSRRDWPAAQTLLKAARAACEAGQWTLSLADCDRLLAEIAVRRGDCPSAQRRLAGARAIYEREEQHVRIALCDLLDGELCLAKGNITAAEVLLTRARDCLMDIFPDIAWQANRALGDCALRQGRRQAALGKYMSGVRQLHGLRSPLPSERLSASFFAGREPLFAATLDLAMAEGAWEQALEVCEATRATTFTLFLQARGRPARKQQDQSARIRNLSEEAAHLRNELADLYRQTDAAGYLRLAAQGKPIHLSQPHGTTDSLERFRTLSRRYEEVSEQIRLARSETRTSGAATEAAKLEGFSLPELRQRLSEQVGPRWMCLIYYVAGQTVHLLSVSAYNLNGWTVQLTPLQQDALEQCTTNADNSRAMLLQDATSEMDGGQQALRELYDVLIPAEVRGQLSALDLLVIVPHGKLHALPFQALRDETSYLIEHTPLVYTPSLHSLQILLATPLPASNAAQETFESTAAQSALLCGVSDFGAQAGALPGTHKEIEALAQLMGRSAKTLEDSDATARAIQNLNASGELASYRFVHFATHGIAESESALQSRILLHQSELTAADVLELRLDRALVSLSACASNLGTVGGGDELLNLARVFFYAGAQTLVASQWSIADEPARHLMVEFYQRLAQGERPARALQQAQCALAREGQPPYEWAAFNVIGTP